MRQPPCGCPPSRARYCRGRVPGIGKRNRFSPFRESVAGEDFGREVPGGDSNFLSEGIVEAKEGGGDYRGGFDPGVEVPGEASEAVVECGGHCGSSHHRTGGCTPLFWFLRGKVVPCYRFPARKGSVMQFSSPFSFRGWLIHGRGPLSSTPC